MDPKGNLTILWRISDTTHEGRTPWIDTDGARVGNLSLRKHLRWFIALCVAGNCG